MSRRLREVVSCAALGAMLSVGWGGDSTQAQSGAVQEAAASSKTAETKEIGFDIPAGPLGGALQQWAKVSGMKLLVPAATVRDKAVPALAGRFTPERALGELLRHSDLRYVMNGTRSVTVYDPNAALDSLAQMTLDPIVVEGPDGNQSPNGPGVGYLATRTGSGTKTDTPIIEVPQSISVVTRQQMNDRGVQNLNEALRYTAGVQIGDTSDLTSESITIRGYNAPWIAIFRDGARDMFRAFDGVVEPYGLERIEVLKGPASVLFGQGYPGGIINLVTKRPTETPFAEVQGQYGSFDRKQGAFDLGGPVTADKSILFRLTGLGRLSDTQIEYVPDDRIFIAPAFTFRSPLRDTVLNVFFSYQKDHTSFPDGLPAQGTVWASPSGKIPISRFTGEPDWSKFDRETFSAGYIFDHAFNSVVSLHQSVRFTDSTYERHQIQNRGLQPDLQTINRRARDGIQDSTRVGVDTNLNFKFDTGPARHQVIAGVDYTYAWFNTWMTQGNINSLNLYNPVYGSPVATPVAAFDDREQASQTGLYLQDQIKLWEKLILVGGVRQDYAWDRIHDLLTPMVQQQRDQALTSRFGVVYLGPYGLAPYASYTESFLPVFGSDSNQRLFKPETGVQYEVGIKFEPPGYNTLATLSAFHAVRENVVSFTPNFDSYQTGEVTTKGVEFEVTANLTRELRVIGTVTLLDAEVTKSEDPNELGKRPVAVPNEMASLWAHYAFKDGSLNGFSVGAGVRYVGDTPGNLANTFFVPAHTVVDAALQYEIKNLRFALNISNLFDTEYVSTCFSRDSCYYGGARTVLGTVTYRW